MSDPSERYHRLVEIFARFICGGLAGVLVSLGWTYFGPVDVSPVLNWIIFIGAIVICGVLAVRYGDDFWSRILPWIDW